MDWISMLTYNYVDNVNANLICCICRAPFVEPTITATCAHTFCRECISRSLECAACCPVDRSPLTPADLRPENLLLRNMVDELLVACTYRATGCVHTCQRQLLAAHLREACPYAPVACDADGCAERVLRRDRTTHAHACVHRVLPCPACGSAVRAAELESHRSDCVAQDVTCPFCSETFARAELEQHNASCTHFVIPCTHSANGCPWNGPRNTLEDTHLPQCPYESIKGFFAVNDARLSSLQDENTLLKQKIQEMDSVICSVRHDLQIARRALGPWWHIEGVSSHHPTSHDTPATLQSRARRGSRSSTPLSALHVFFTDRAGGDSAEPYAADAPFDPAFLAPYFPPAHDEAEAGHAASPASPSADHDYPYLPSLGSAFSPRLGDLPVSRPPPQAAVAPLDLSTTVEGALAGLRSSVAVLAAALDSLSRRQDLALTTENLRMTEEVGALRAVVHGLRMQVHSIMLERHNQIIGRSGDGQEWVTTAHYYNHPPSVPHTMLIPSTTSVTKL